MRVWGRRIGGCVAVACVALVAFGCAPRLQSFSPIESPFIYNISSSDVANQVRCELNDFLYAYNANIKKDNVKHFHLSQTPADVNMTLQTDIGGYVQYLGIDLKQAGFSSLSDLVAANGKSPSLGAKISPKSTVSATVAMTIPQKTASTLIDTKCEKYLKSLKSQVRNLWLEQWLLHFFEDADNIYIDDQHVTTKKNNDLGLESVKLSTTFTIAVDISAGLNPFFGTSYLVPISGMNADFNPQLMHKLDVTFYICRDSVGVTTNDCAAKEKDKTKTQSNSATRGNSSSITLSDVSDAAAKKIADAVKKSSSH